MATLFAINLPFKICLSFLSTPILLELCGSTKILSNPAGDLLNRVCSFFLREIAAARLFFHRCNLGPLSSPFTAGRGKEGESKEERGEVKAKSKRTREEKRPLLLATIFRVDGAFESFRIPCRWSKIREFCQVRNQTLSLDGIQDKNYEIKLYKFCSSWVPLLFRSEQQHSVCKAPPPRTDLGKEATRRISGGDLCPFNPTSALLAGCNL